ncbi:MAG: hypothetical protein IPM66_03775 [Acidobacteriota bacterium]|nr:MAG: hypothetical protein IPM66_03775 [Acidobacteriota bacterium]
MNYEKPISNSIAFRFRWIYPVLLVSALVAGTAHAQSSVEKAETSKQVEQRVDELERARNAVAKPGEKQEPTRTGALWGDYSVTSSIEVGYRSVDINGSRDKYLSDVNLRDGFRLLEYSLDSRSLTGSGPLYDFLKAEVTTAGGDPSQTFSLRMDKARAYKFDGTVRRFNYFRYLPTFANNWHNIDTRQQMSDFHLKLFPQRAVRVNLGYSRAMAKGFSQWTNSAERDIFVQPGERRWESNDFRLGVDATYRGWDFFIEQMHRNFRWDSTAAWTTGINAGFFPTDNATLTLFNRDEPMRTNGNLTRGSIRGSIGNRVHVATRGLYGEEHMRMVFFENYAGNAASPANTKVLTNQYSNTGNARRPSASFDGVVSVDLTESLTLSNSFRYSHYRILGDVLANTFRQQQTGTGAVVTSNPSPFSPSQAVPGGIFGSLGTDLTSYWNTVDFQYAPSRKFMMSAGWRTTRRNVGITALNAVEEDTLTTNTGIANVRIRPVDRLNLFFDYENGTADNVFVRINAMDFQRVRARVNLQATDTLSLTGTFSATDRTNPTPQVENDSDYRSYSISALWEPTSRFYLTGGYNYDDLFSTANIFYFINNVARTGKSLYYARQNFFFFDSRIGVSKYLDLFVLYRYVNDGGAPSSANAGAGADDFVTSFPLNRHNPEARLAIHAGNRVTFNVSYRHFSYNEDTFNVQDYRSNIVTSSVRFTF